MFFFHISLNFLTAVLCLLSYSGLQNLNQPLTVMNTYSSSSLAKHLSEKCWLNLQFLAMYYITIPLHLYFSENYYILLPKEYVQLIIILLPTKCYV